MDEDTMQVIIWRFSNHVKNLRTFLRMLEEPIVENKGTLSVDEFVEAIGRISTIEDELKGLKQLFVFKDLDMNAAIEQYRARRS